MDPGDLDFSLPQPDNPCLIVEDSQPDSVALEDDPESSFRALLARRLSSLQPAARSPVLELISSPFGIRSSQTDSQQSPDQLEPDIVTSVSQEESQVVTVGPPAVQKSCSSEEPEMDSGADSTTHCIQSEGESSQFGFLELSQSQDQGAAGLNSQHGDIVPPSDSDRRSRSEQNISSRAPECLVNKSVRSEVSSSSSSDSPGQPGRQLTVQALLHSQNLSQGPQCEALSSQQDLFDHNKSGAVVDSTVLELIQQGAPTPTPAHTLRLLHLSGQGTLVQESLSQTSVDFVAPTPDNTPLIVPSSPTAPENGSEEPMDTSLPPEDGAAGRDEPMETEAASSKPHPAASTPVSHSAPGFLLERPLSIPSQPEFSHDVFVPTQSQVTSASLPVHTPSQRLDASAPPAVALQLSEEEEVVEEEEEVKDSQATQIEQLDNQKSDSAPSGSQAAESPPRGGELSVPPQKPDPPTTLDVRGVGSASGAPPLKFDSIDLTANSCVQETPGEVTHRSLPSQSVISQTYAVEVARSSIDVRGVRAKNQSGAVSNSQTRVEEEEQEEVMEEERNTRGASGVTLALSQSQVLSPEPMEKEEEEGGRGDGSIIVVTDSERSSQVPRRDAKPPSQTNSSQPIRDKTSASTNGHQAQLLEKPAPDRLSQMERAGLEAEGLKDRSLSDSSGEISFHFTLPKEGELIGPVVGATPPLINQLKQTLRHSTPIEISSFSKAAADVPADVVMTAGAVVSGGESLEEAGERGDGKLSLRMKLVTPVEEGSSEGFSLQKPTLTGEDGSVAKVMTTSNSVTSTSVFTRVRQVHRQQEADEDGQPGGNGTRVRSQLFDSPLRSSQASSLGCNSLPNSQSEASATPQGNLNVAEASDERREPEKPPPPPPPPVNRKTVRPRVENNTNSSTPASKVHQRPGSQQSSFEAAAGVRSPAGRGEPESPSFRRGAAPLHRRHVRTIQEVRTTVTRIITDVYYEDGKEVDCKVTEESEDPVVDCQVLDSDVSPCRTGSSMTSGDLADVSSLSSKASSVHASSGGTSSSAGFSRPDFIMPLSRGAKSTSPGRGGGHQRRGHRGHRRGSVVTVSRDHAALGPQALVPHSLRGRARRGRPPSRSSMSRGGGGVQRLLSSEDELPGRTLPPRLAASSSDREPAGPSDSLRSSPEEAGSAGTSFVGLRVVAKWSSNGYFYSGRIVKDAGKQLFRLRFDDGYECEVAGKDILLCDPIPLETEVTALLEDEYFSIGVVKGHKTEGQDLFYSVERDGLTQWYCRTSVILSLEQGNRLREQHSLGPYEPFTPATKASDISLDNLVEGKRRRKGTPGGQSTPIRSSSSSSSSSTPTTSASSNLRTPRPSGKRKLMSSEDRGSLAKRGRRRGGARAARRVGVCNTSGSGTDLPGRAAADAAATHGPLPQNTALFMGFAFMLTASSENDRLTNKLTGGDDDEEEEEGEEEEEDYVETAPYNKGYTESQLQAGGGFVLPDFNEEQCKAAYQSLLIADQHCRTRKYLLCLASGVPCVSHIWVRDCCNENKLLNYRNYLLPAGVGPDDAIVEWHPRSSPFKALKVLLVFERPVELWAQLVTLGGATTVRHYQAEKDAADDPAGQFDVAVTDGACPPAVEKNLTSQEVPLVSPEWLIQSLICGEQMGFHSKPEYHHTSSSSSSTSTSTSS